MKFSPTVLVPSLLFLTVVTNAFLFLQLIAPPGHYDLGNVSKQNESSVLALEADRFAPFMPYTLEWELVDSEIHGPYRVETYREVKTVLNEKGEPVKTIPTGQYQYLRYWIGN
ncbi:hypothetical protein BSNK01_27710 [Bacillaceae bacterium]